MSKEWFIKEGGQVCFKSDNAELNGWDTQSLVDCLNGKEIKIADLETKLADMTKKYELASFPIGGLVDMARKLEQQLKESEHRNEQLVDALNGEVFINYKLPMENAQLKQQLAEKDKEIETILKENEELVIKHNVYNWGDKIQKDKVYSLTGEALELLINRQNKLAIGLLEKVKENIKKVPITDFDLSGNFEKMYKQDAIRQIDNQINELKGEV